MFRRLTRRTLLAGAAGASLAGCAGFPSAAGGRDPRGLIDALVAAGHVPAAGLVVRREGRTVFSHTAGLAQGAGGEAAPAPFTPETRMRIASVSKLGLALTAHRLAAAGVVDLDADIAAAFDPPLRHPAYPQAPVTLRQLLSHTAGLQDPDVYWMPAPGRTEDLFTPQMWRPASAGAPGASFTYANFGYGLAAHVLERAARLRFDLLAERLVFGPLGLDCGFNWSAVPAASRRAGATLYGFERGGWQPAADGPAVLAGDSPSILSEPGFALSSYVPGTNGTLFSPQGGLRASLDDMARLARAVADEPGMRTAVWTFDPARPNGDSDGGYFAAYSAGAQIHPSTDSPLSGLSLIGHHGEAYGLYTAAFHVPELNAEFAFSVTGTKPDGAGRSARHPVMVEATAPLWEAARLILAGSWT